jgi:hypothetical protein
VRSGERSNSAPRSLGGHHLVNWRGEELDARQGQSLSRWPTRGGAASDRNNGDGAPLTIGGRVVRALTSNEHAISTGRAPSIGHCAVGLYVSVVCATDGARFVTVAASEQDCLVRIASYVAEQAARQLWPPSAQRVHELLAAGDAAAAVAEYFRHTGERWDREWLVTTPLDADPRSTAWSGTIPLP